MSEMNVRYKSILRFAKSKGYLSPIWLLSHSDAQSVQRAFDELETFLHSSFLEGKFRESSLTDIENFVWTLKKNYAFNGWDGIAPFLLNAISARKVVIPEMNV